VNGLDGTGKILMTRKCGKEVGGIDFSDWVKNVEIFVFHVNDDLS
jgi:hypothetical protein